MIRITQNGRRPAPFGAHRNWTYMIITYSQVRASRTAYNVCPSCNGVRLSGSAVVGPHAPGRHQPSCHPRSSPFLRAPVQVGGVPRALGLGLGSRASRAIRAAALPTRSVRGPLRAAAAKRRPDWPHPLPRAMACRGPAGTSWHVRPGLPACPGASRRGRSDRDVAAA